MYRRTLPLLTAALLHSALSAQTVSFYEDQGRLIRAPRALGVLGDSLMGDRINFYNGGLSFTHTDISLPGNDNLPMNITRHLSVGKWNAALGLFGRWELDIPHVQGTFGADYGWDVVKGTNYHSYQRCSSFGPPGTAHGSNNNQGYFSAQEFWHGNFLHLPGGETQEMLLRDSANPHVPDDGNSYPVVTKNLWAFRCLPNLANPSSIADENGEAFLAVAPDGTQYQFDWMVKRGMSSLTRPGLLPTTGLSANEPPITNTDTKPLPSNSGDHQEGNTSSNGFLVRNEVLLLPTKITDRFGNTLTYRYDSTDPWKLLSMTASDGRTLTFTYVTGTHQIDTISDGTRTWHYTYVPNSDQTPGVVLNEVINPDQSKWQLADIDRLVRDITYVTSPTCETGGVLSPVVMSANMVHPSGAIGTFSLTATLHGRSQVTRRCTTVGPIESRSEIATYPKYIANFSLVQKTLTGPGLPSMTWRASYSAATPSWADCTTCVDTKTTTVTDPNNDVTRYTFGTRFLANEGLLLKTENGWDGNTALRTTTIRYRDPAAGPYPAKIGASGQRRGDSEVNTHFMVQDLRTTTQQGATFTWQADANSFDTKARPGIVTKSSTLGYSRSEQTVYKDFATKWVLGQVESVTERNTGFVIMSNTFDPVSLNVASTSHFGHLDMSMSYNSDGTLASRTDGKGQTTTFTDYKRGLARNVRYPDNSTQSAVVNDIGLIDSTTDENGFTTGYTYDDAGRLRVIYYPAGDSVNWTPTVINYEQINSDEVGLAAGHWRQTVTTGNATAVTWLDAFWRPVLSSTYDAANQDATRRMSLNRYDYRGQPTFTSYPQRTISSINDNVPGSVTRFDALARPIQVSADSELGKLTTTTIYDTGFKKTVTNPRGYVMSTTYQAFDEASEAAIARIDEPKGISIVINRDLFGKPKAITRSGPSSTFTRNYVYDAHQRMCKIIDPEIGATMQDYDLANNVAWRSIGLPDLLSTEMCGYSNVPANRRINYGYDARNRLSSTSYGDGTSPGITRTYTPDGLPNTITSDGATWTMSYNKRRLPELESLSFAGNTYDIRHGYDAIGANSSLTYPDGSKLEFAPNALGESTKVGGYASNISYYPNGAIAGFNYGNGIAHSMTQNARTLPEVSQDGTVIKDKYSYDPNGNVTAIFDQQNTDYGRAMTYDELDRLATAEALGIWGRASYIYDAQDNMIQSTVGTRSITHVIDTSNRLSSINSTTPGYSQTYTYDLQGNLSKRGNQVFTFDQGNRLKSVPGIASYQYDGLGRRVKISNVDGSSRIQVYSAAGQLLYSTQSGAAGPATTKYVYLRHGLIAEVAK